jgi:hypothetical protein
MLRVSSASGAAARATWYTLTRSSGNVNRQIAGSAILARTNARSITNSMRITTLITSDCRYWFSTSSSSNNADSENSSVAADNKKPSSDKELLDNIEEIVDIPSSALEDVIDRSRFTQQIPVKMPDMDAGGKSKVVHWYFSPGDVIQRGSVLCDIETPGFTFGMETDDEELAIMGETLVELNEPVPDNAVICMLYHETSSKEEGDDKAKDANEPSSEPTKDKDKDTH